MSRFINQDLNQDISKICDYDGIITIAKAVDHELDVPFAIDVEDGSYFYHNEENRNKDYEELDNFFAHFSNFKFVG